MILIIGMGNTLRQDDGAGWALAERLAGELRTLGRPSRVVFMQQLAPETALELTAGDVTSVCFADVAVDAQGLSLLRIDDEGEADAPAQITHQIGPGTVLAYASVIGWRATPAWLFTIGGTAFGHGEGLSEVVKAGLSDAAALRVAAVQIAQEDSGPVRTD